MIAPALWVEIVGWIGALLILAAYAMLTAGRITARSTAYQGMNVLGAAAFVVNGLSHGALPSVVLNVIWAAIGVVALARMRA